LSDIRVRKNFQGEQPVLVGGCSLPYCYLLAAAESRRKHLGLSFAGGDGARLHPGIRLLMQPKGWGAGQAALADTPCHGDLFHIQQQCQSLTNILSPSGWSDFATAEDWAADAASQTAELWDRLSTRLTLARRAKQAVQLAKDVKTLPLAQPWCFALGLSATPARLFDFIVARCRGQRMSSHSLAMCCSAKTTGWPTRLCQGTRWELVEIAQRFDTRSSSFGVCLLHEENHLDCLLDSLESTPPSTFRKVSSGPRSGKGGNATNTRASSLVEISTLVYAITASAAGTSTWLLSFPQPSHIYAQWYPKVGKSPTQLMTERQSSLARNFWVSSGFNALIPTPKLSFAYSSVLTSYLL